MVFQFKYRSNKHVLHIELWARCQGYREKKRGTDLTQYCDGAEEVASADCGTNDRLEPEEGLLFMKVFFYLQKHF